MSTIFREDKSGEVSLDVSYTQKNKISEKKYLIPVKYF
jgi:hypothetical protein